jgi:hypothetical protein
MLMVSTVPVAAENDQASPIRIQYGFDIQDYQWKEYDDHDAKLVDETGYLYGLTCDVDSSRKNLGWRGGISLFGGEVDYEGVT